MAKMTGKEFKDFLRDPAVWGAEDNAIVDDSVIEVDGVEMEEWPCTNDVSDGSRIRVLSGYLEMQPKGVPDDFVKAARWWLKRQTTVTLIVECHKDEREAVASAIKAAGGKIL